MEWMYLIGYLWFWRYHVGAAMSLDNCGTPDGVDFAFGMFFGTLTCIFWPLTVIGRGIYVLWVKHDKGRTRLINLFPAPRKVETAEAKRERLAREAEEKNYRERRAIQSQREYINDRERELGITPTVWSN